MDPVSASAQLQIIRTLMERVALYRRALAPCSLLAGAAGVTAALIGWGLELSTLPAFLLLWISTAVLTLSGVFLMIRREAVRNTEPFWTPPTRRVAAAFLPPMVAAVAATALLPGWIGSEARWVPALLASVWMACYGLGLHAAGFFMPRGIRWLGWVFLAGSVVIPCVLDRQARSGPAGFATANAMMGIAFGGIHLAYGFYLRLTRSPATT
jgi:hypothetical protein